MTGFLRRCLTFAFERRRRPRKRSFTQRLVLVGRRGRHYFAILTIDNNGWVYDGTPLFGKPIMKISGEQIYRGSSSWGAPIATVKGDYVYSGTGFLSAPIAVIDGDYVYEGSTKMGGPIANVSGGGRMSAAAAAADLLLM